VRRSSAHRYCKNCSVLSMLKYLVSILNIEQSMQIDRGRNCEDNDDKGPTLKDEDKRIVDVGENAECIETNREERVSDQELVEEVTEKPYFWVYWDDLGYMIKYTVEE